MPLDYEVIKRAQERLRRKRPVVQAHSGQLLEQVGWARSDGETWSVRGMEQADFGGGWVPVYRFVAEMKVD